MSSPQRRTNVLQLPWHHLDMGEMELLCHQVLNWELLFPLMFSRMQLFTLQFISCELKTPPETLPSSCLVKWSQVKCVANCWLV